MSYQVGDLVRVSAVFTDAEGEAVDPTAVYVSYRSKGEDAITLHYGVDAGLVKDSTGTYHTDISVMVKGVWSYRFYSTGTGQAANEDQFFVSPSEFGG